MPRKKKPKRLGDQLRFLIDEYCEEKKISRYELAKWSGMTPQRLYLFQNKSRGLGMSAIEDLCITMGVTLHMGEQP